jgi:hypothetical protein
MSVDKSGEAPGGNGRKRRKEDLSSQEGPSTEGAGSMVVDQSEEDTDGNSRKRRKTVAVSSKVSVTGRSKQGGPGTDIAGEMEVDESQVANSSKLKQIRRVRLIVR